MGVDRIVIIEFSKSNDGYHGTTQLYFVSCSLGHVAYV